MELLKRVVIFPFCEVIRTLTPKKRYLKICVCVRARVRGLIYLMSVFLTGLQGSQCRNGNLIAVLLSGSTKMPSIVPGTE